MTYILTTTISLFILFMASLLCYWRCKRTLDKFNSWSHQEWEEYLKNRK